MELLFLCFFLCLPRVRSQALLSVLQQHSELTIFNQFVNNSQSLTNLLSSADNVTLFAPSNAAFEAWIPNQPPTMTKDQIEALLMYHLVHGVFPSDQFSNEPQFSRSFLTNTSYVNITGGQRVELVTNSGGNPAVFSGNKTMSAISRTDVTFTGGLIQIIDTVLTLPLSYVVLITQANFRFMATILFAGGYLSANDIPLINNTIYTPNNTLFAPNTQEAVNTLTSLAPSMSQDQLAGIFNYHVVTGFLAYSPQLTDGMQLRTSQGTNLTITVRGNTTFVNGARIITYDYLVCNGVVHMIDSILDPSNTTGPPPLSTPTTYTTANTPSSSSIPSTDLTPKATWTPASKAGVGVGAFLILVSLSGATYFLIRFIRNRTSSSKKQRPAKPTVIWNVGPAWTKKVERQIVKGKRKGKGKGGTGPSPQELDAEEKGAGRGHEWVMSPGASEASTVTEYGGSGRATQGSTVRGYEGSPGSGTTTTTQGSWGGELDGNARHHVVRGHRNEF